MKKITDMLTRIADLQVAFKQIINDSWVYTPGKGNSRQHNRATRITDAGLIKVNNAENALYELLGAGIKYL